MLDEDGDEHEEAAGSDSRAAAVASPCAEFVATMPMCVSRPPTRALRHGGVRERSGAVSKPKSPWPTVMARMPMSLSRPSGSEASESSSFPLDSGVE